MDRRNIRERSNYFLLRQLLYGGKAGMDSEVEPVSVFEVVSEMESRFCTGFEEDIGLWVEWVATAESPFDEEEVNSLLVTYKLLRAEKKYFEQ